MCWRPKYGVPIVLIFTIPKCGKRNQAILKSVTKNGMIYSGDVQAPNVQFGNANIFRGFQWQYELQRGELMATLSLNSQAEHWRTFQWGIGSRPGLKASMVMIATMFSGIEYLYIVGIYTYKYTYTYMYTYTYT